MQTGDDVSLATEEDRMTNRIETLEHVTAPWTLHVPGAAPVRVSIEPLTHGVRVTLDGSGRVYDHPDQMVPESDDPVLVMAWDRIRARAARAVERAEAERRGRELGTSPRAAAGVLERLAWRLPRIRAYLGTPEGAWGETMEAWGRFDAGDEEAIADVRVALLVLEPSAVHPSRR